MDSKALASMRDQRLHRQFRYQLYAFSTFYRKQFEQLQLAPDAILKVADLPQAPLVSRAMLAASPNEFFLRPTRSLIQKFGAAGQLFSVSVEMILHGSKRSEQLVRHEYEPVHQLATAGTQGAPVTIDLSRRDLASLAIQGQRMLEVAGVNAADKILNLLPNQPSGGFWTTWLGGVALGVEQTAPGALDPDEAARALAEGRPSVVIADASALLGLLEAARRPPSELQTLILGPRVTPPSLRRQIEEAAGSQIKVLATYGFAEGRAVWSECSQGGAGSGFHSYPDGEVFEVVSSETEAPVDPQSGGELVFTGLDQRGTALARYRPGDVVSSLQAGVCPYCGRNVDRIMGPIRRVGNIVTVHAGGSAPVEIDQAVLAGALDHPDLAGWQLEVTKMPGQSNGYDDLLLLFQPRAQKDPATLAVELDAILRRKVGVSPQQVLSDRTGGGLLDLRK